MKKEEEEEIGWKTYYWMREIQVFFLYEIYNFTLKAKPFTHFNDGKKLWLKTIRCIKFNVKKIKTLYNCWKIRKM